MCTLTLLGDHGTFKDAEVRRQVWATPHLRNHLTNRKWKPCARACRRGFKILINEEIDSFSFK